MSENFQALSERQGLDEGVFEALKSENPSALSEISQRSQIPEIQLFGAKSFYDVPKDRITKKNFFGKCDFERDGIKIPFYSHVSDSVYGLKFLDSEEVYDLVLKSRSRISREVRDSGLSGRGGAGFSFSKKLEICTQRASEKKYVICNGEEGDTGAFSDKYLLESQPRLVLAGMYAAGLTMGAQEGVLYVSDEYLRAIEILKTEVKKFERTKAFHQAPFHFRVVRGDNAYITGEESALLNSLEGQRAEARARPPFPGEEGLFKKPTLVSNVETFASLPWILKNGGSKHARFGTKSSHGVKLISLGNHFRTPGVHEVEFGTSVEKVLHEFGGGFSQEIKALQIGGPLGGVVPMSKISQLNLSIESFRDEGFLLGHASIVAIPECLSMINFLRDLFEFTANESCGKCFPCRLGSKAAADLLENSSREKIDPTVFNDLVETLKLGSLCGLGGGVPIPVENVLKYFSHELVGIFKEGSL